MAAVGDVYFLRCKNCNPPKDKFFVVALEDPLKLFLINSNMTDFQAARQEFVSAQAAVLAVEHDFLDHDSLVGCDWLHHEYDIAALNAAMLLDRRFRKVGQLSQGARAAVANALKGNVHIPGRWLKLIQQKWP